MATSTATLHYVFDPLGGWCYGAAPLVKAAHQVGIQIKMHGGGLWDPARKIDLSMREHIKSNDSSINSLTGQRFGQKYFDNVLGNPEMIVWSQPTIDAVLAAGKLGEELSRDVVTHQLAMMESIQTAYYVLGRHVGDLEVLKQIATEMGLDAGAFEKKLNASAAAKHIKQSRKFMKSVNVSGFPNFVLEKSDKTMHRVDHSKFYGKPDKFVKQLNSMM